MSHLPHDMSPHSQSRLTASSTTTGLACYGYIKQSAVIDKLSLRLGEGGSCVNIIMMLSMTLTLSEHPLGQIEV